MVTVTAFEGPITAFEIVKWFARCEDIFEDADENNATHPLTDKDKIHAAGRAISKQGTNDLYDWWTENRKKLEGKGWDEFRDAFKQRALGRGWRIAVLKDFYTTAQDGKTLGSYFKELGDKKFIIERSTPLLPPIDEFVYKCHLLFHATPGLTTQVLKNGINDKAFLDADSDEVEEWLSKYDSGGTPARISQVTTPGMWVLSGLSGYNEGSGFTDLFGLPSKSDGLGTVTNISVWYNTARPLIERYQIQFSDPAFSISNPAQFSTTTNQTLNLGVGEYVAAIKLYFQNQTFRNNSYNEITIHAITAIEIQSVDPNKKLAVGTTTTDVVSIAAPSGWRIVGFYGTSASTTEYAVTGLRYYIPRLGAIFAPA